MFTLLETIGLINLGDRLQQVYRKRKNQPSEPENIATRFIDLCEHHGVNRNQIPKFFDCNLTFADVQSGDALLPKLTDELIEQACELFLVNREWLEGHSEDIYEVKHFYKNPDKFEKFITELTEKAPKHHFSCILLISDNMKKSRNSVILIEEILENETGIEFFRYYQCPFADFTYWKSRAYITACIAIATQKLGYVKGVRVTPELIEKYQQSDHLMGWFGEYCSLTIEGKRWNPEKLVTNPKVYLKDINPERERFGILVGLSKWKELSEQGYMNLGFGDNPAYIFEEEYKKQLNRW